MGYSASQSTNVSGTAKGSTGGGNVFNAGSVFGNTSNSGQGGGAGGGAGSSGGGSGFSTTTLLYAALAAVVLIGGWLVIRK